MDFYYMDLSAPCRAVRLTLSALGLSPNMKILDVMVGDQNKPEFLAINPQHCIPTLVDEKITIWERYIYSKEVFILFRNIQSKCEGLNFISQVLIYSMNCEYNFNYLMND